MTANIVEHELNRLSNLIGSCFECTGIDCTVLLSTENNEVVYSPVILMSNGSSIIYKTRKPAHAVARYALRLESGSFPGDSPIAYGTQTLKPAQRLHDTNLQIKGGATNLA